jgi:hypothetical protein
VNQHIGKIDTIRRDLGDKACPSCGSDEYHLVLRPDGESQPEGISARCSQCQRVREVDEDLG